MPTLPIDAIKRGPLALNGTHIGSPPSPASGKATPSKPSKPIQRLTVLLNAQPISNEGELVGRSVVVVRGPCTGMRGKIVKVVTAERLKEEAKTKGHRDVFYTIETDKSYIVGAIWVDFLQTHDHEVFRGRQG